MLYLIVVGCGAALVHVALVRLARRAQPSFCPPAWLRVAWVALLVLVAAVAVRHSPGPPTDLIDAFGLFWVVPAVDVFVLLTAMTVLSDRGDAGHIADRRRLLLGVLTTGALGAAGFAGYRQGASAGAAPVPERSAPSQIDPLANGAVGSYTGRFGTAGDGVDSRAAIQAALNAASDVIGTDYYSYTRRRSTTVALAPGHYLISAPDEDASLVIPPGVVLDAASATLYFDYPSRPRASWCGIRVGQDGQLRLGKLYPSERVAAPDTELVYDAVRLVQTDSNSRVVGYGDSEIRGWQGAAIRGVGAWLVFVKGVSFSNNAYGYIASRTGDGTLGYAVSQPDGSSVRNHTDLRIQDCSFVNLSHGGIVGAVQGDSNRLLERDYESLSLTVGLVGCIFENIAGCALDIASAMVVSAWDCAFEEVGADGGAMVRLDNCRVVSFAGTRVNLEGRLVPGPEGETRPFPAYVFHVAATESFVIDGMRAYNSFNPALRLADAEATVSWRIGNISAAAGALSPGPMYVEDGSFAVSGQWNKGHIVLGSHHLWVDGFGALRHKNGRPLGDTDGGVVG